MKHGQINVHHYETHGDNSSHYVKVSDAVYVHFGRCSQQRNSRDETKSNLCISRWWTRKEVIRRESIIELIPGNQRHGDWKGFHVTTADQIIIALCDALRLLLEETKIDADSRAGGQHEDKCCVVGPSEFL
jgi:hypothetical protein